MGSGRVVSDNVKIVTASGDVRVVGEARSDVIVEGANIDTDAHGRRIIAAGSRSVEVRCPAGTDLVVGSASGDVEIDGPLGDVRVTTASGDVRVAEVRSIDLRSASGDLEVGRCAGTARVRTGSGHVRLGEVHGVAEVATVSGRIAVASAAGPLKVRSVSGDAHVGVIGTGGVTVRTVSGTIVATMSPELRPDLRLTSGSGRVRTDTPPGQEFVVSAASVSGDITVGPR